MHREGPANAGPSHSRAPEPARRFAPPSAGVLACGALAFLALAGLLVWRQFIPNPERDPGRSAAPGDRIRGAAAVLDAGALLVDGVRLHVAGIAPPAFTQTCGSGLRRWSCGARAMIALRDHLQGRRVECTVLPRDAHAAVTATRADCTADGEDIARWLVQAGWARASRPGLHQDQTIAQRSGLGQWGDGTARDAAAPVASEPNGQPRGAEDRPDRDRRRERRTR